MEDMKIQSTPVSMKTLENKIFLVYTMGFIDLPLKFLILDMQGQRY